MKRVIVVGGGLAGLAATARLVEHGFYVDLFESRPRLGGRASSFVDQTTGERIDNCQHVNMGCCTNYQHFCRLVGVDHLFRTEEELYFIGRDNHINRFRAGWGPAPLHLTSAFHRLSYLTRAEKKQLSRGLLALAKRENLQCSQQSMADWLQKHQQTEGVIDKFWKVVLVSALSEDLDRISVPHARKVFVDAFLANREGWKMQVPTVPLDELYGTAMENWFSERNVSIHRQTGVEKLQMSDDGQQVTGVQLRNGDVCHGDFVIVAVPHFRLGDLLPDSLQNVPAFQKPALLETAPISSVHLWFDRSVMPLPHAVLIDRISQWIFDRSSLLQQHQAGKECWHAYQVVISASRNLSGRTQDEIRADILQELAEIWPGFVQAELKHARMVTEHRAVFSVSPSSDDCRLPQQSPVPNLLLAGDWTRTGWPATMEGAVRSGYLAAERILDQCGESVTLLQPDLPVARLSRWLLGL